MQNDLIHISWLSAAFLMLFAIAEILYRVMKVKAEVSRKFVHVFTGVLTLLFPVFLQSHWSVLVLCASFALILLLSLRFGWLPSINAIDRRSSGSLLYPLSVYLAFLFYGYNNNQLLYFYLPVLTLAICDPLAALAGKNFPFGCFRIVGGNKTLTGCAAFFITAVALTLFLLYLCNSALFDDEKTGLTILLVALCSTVAEALSGNGWDNLSIPLTVMAVMLMV